MLYLRYIPVIFAKTLKIIFFIYSEFAKKTCPFMRGKDVANLATSFAFNLAES